MVRKAVEVVVRGRVQGVGFRAWTESEARALELSGWVRNEADGSVRAALGGEAGAVDRMLARLREGPAQGRVDALEVTEPADMPRGDFGTRV